jgi:AbrB family looped-hinge helix DNA binding protein
MAIDFGADRGRQLARLQIIEPVAENSFGIVGAHFRDSFREFEEAIGVAIGQRILLDLTSGRDAVETTRLSSKGQVILPKSVREAHCWPPGTEFLVESTEEGVLLRPRKRLRSSCLDEVAGCLRTPRPAATIAEMEAAIDAEIKARRDRGRY